MSHYGIKYLPVGEMGQMLRAASALIATCTSLIAASPAADPFAGTWKFNHKKSDLKSQTETIASLGGNKFRVLYDDVCAVEIGVACGGELSFEIKADGTDQLRFPSTTWAVTIKDPRSWEILHKTNGLPVATELWTLSSDGRSLSETYGSSMRRPDGSAISSTQVLKRVSGADGFAGTWWIKDVSVSNPYERVLEIAVPIRDVLVVSYPTMTIIFDGMDFPLQAPPWLPAGSVASARRIDARSIKITYKFGGQMLDMSDWTVSPDGNTLRVTDQGIGRRPATTSIYERR